MSEQEVEQETPETEKGTAFADFSEHPELEKRFKRVYGNMKEYERQNQQLVRDQKTAINKIATMEEKLESVLQDTTEQRLEGLRAEKAAAYEAGEIDKVLDIDERILDTKIAKPEPAAEPIEEEPAIPVETQNRITEWSNEIDDQGNYLRPWSHPSHPMAGKAIPIASGVLSDPEFGGRPTEDLLEEIEKRVTKALDLNQPKQRGQSVLSTNSDVSPGTGKTKLNAEQKEVARRMFPKVSPADAEKKYAKALG